MLLIAILEVHGTGCTDVDLVRLSPACRVVHEVNEEKDQIE